MGIGPIPTSVGIEVELRISLPGLDREAAQTLVDRAHIVCPYSNATRGNIDVTLTIVCPPGANADGQAVSGPKRRTPQPPQYRCGLPLNIAKVIAIGVPASP